MAEDELSDKMRGLRDAIRSHPNPVQVVLCGFNLYLEVLGSPHLKSRNMTWGGTFATGDEPEEAILVPIPVLGGRIVVSFDPTVPADAFKLKP